MTTTESVGQAPLLDHYRAIESRAQQMLQSAQAGHWDDVERARDECRRLIDALQRARSEGALSRIEDGERLRILRTIVLCDGQTRQLSSPPVRWLDRLLETRASGA